MLIAQINSIITFAIGLPVNLLLCWLILYRTNEQLRVWSIVLFQSSIFDMISMMLSLFCQQIVVIIDNKMYMIINGPFADSKIEVKRAISSVFVFFLLFSKYTFSVQFFYRWLVICRDKRISWQFYTALLLIPFTLALLLSMEVFWNLNANISETNMMGYVFISDMESTGIQTALKLWFAVELANIACILLFNFLCWLKSRHELMVQHQQTSRKINRQVTIVLLLQAIYAIVIMMIPSSLTIFNFNYADKFPEWLSLLIYQNWNAIAYPLSTFFIIGHYRRYLAKNIGNWIALFHHSQPRQTSNPNKISPVLPIVS